MTSKGTVGVREAEAPRAALHNHSGKGPMHMQVRRAPLVAVCAIGALLFTASAANADPDVTPEVVAGNPNCESLGLDTVTKFDSPVTSGTKAGVTLTRNGDLFDWESTVAIDAVIAKGGPNANVYSYPFDKFGDDGLHAPMNGAQPYGLSHVEFCTDGEDEPEPNPDILLDKTGAATATAGSTFTYSFKATNTGNVTLTDVELTDDKCQSTLDPRGAEPRPIRRSTRATSGSTPAR